jgi:endogenous inhibitor of DNA gyrase (YacG/DUF329 family)
MEVKTKLAKIIQIFLNSEVITVKCSACQSEVITVKCSACQRIVKYFVFKITVCSFGTQNIKEMNIILAQ